MRGQLALLAARRDVRTRPEGELTHLRSVSIDSPARALQPDEVARARRVALGVSRAAAYGLFRPTCLVRSLAICRRLEEEKVRGAELRVGVARRNGRFVAHAWVELAGEVIGDEESVGERYVALDQLKVMLHS